MPGRMMRFSSALASTIFPGQVQQQPVASIMRWNIKSQLLLELSRLTQTSSWHYKVFEGLGSTTKAVELYFGVNRVRERV